MKDDDNNSNNESRLKQTRELLSELYKIDSEVIVPSEGPPFVEKRDPHLRLRRTLTPPSSKFQGIIQEEAQFMISNSSGKRVSLYFSCLGHDFVCDGYFWGASEETATKRIFAVHGVTPGISRTRWHALGERLANKEDDYDDEERIRFCAIDWHSLDRTVDKPQDAFLTMLPKHFFDSVDDDLFHKMVKDLPADKAAKQKALLESVNEQCPRSIQDGATVLRAMIEQGCGWGTSSDKAFALCIKSWSGGIGTQMLIDAANTDFGKHISGAVIMHPAYFKEQGAAVKEAIEGMPVLMCWARDDPKVPYKLFSQQYLNGGAKIVGPTKGGHANFMEFDDCAAEFLLGL